jgi:hypothetical protein
MMTPPNATTSINHESSVSEHRENVSFQVMRSLGITEAFTNDKHFQAAGFTVLF